MTVFVLVDVITMSGRNLVIAISVGKTSLSPTSALIHQSVVDCNSPARRVRGPDLGALSPSFSKEVKRSLLL